jgi:hypothetical protein
MSPILIAVAVIIGAALAGVAVGELVWRNLDARLKRIRNGEDR